MENSRKYLINIVGPTASGKTSLAIELAQFFKTEIISSDSRQFYQEVSIGTAKPSAAELAEVQHHFINTHSVNDHLNAGDFARAASTLLDQLFLSHQVVIMAGGSGLFIKALTEGLDQLPTANEALRASLNVLYLSNGIEALQDYLKNIAPEELSRIDNKNPQRLMRAIEIASGSAQKVQVPSEKSYVLITVGITPDRASLYERINNRVDNMMHQGLEAEVRAMLPYRSTYAMQTVGYKELFEYMDGNITRERAIELIKQHTRQFAKRQLTWFRNQTDATWFEPSDFTAILALVNRRMEE